MKTESESKPFRHFLTNDTGAVLLEYVTLLLGCFLLIHVTIAPLRDALLVFVADVFEHLSLP